MNRRALFGALILAVAVGALAFRLPRLGERPMHGDEAVQALQSGILAETGVYRYNPIEFHGPSLYYLSLIPMWLSSAHTLAETNECTFRIVPVVFSVGLILLLLLFGDGLGRPAAVCAGVLTAISPAMVYYSRYYIQETLLVFFTFAAIVCGWRYVQSRRLVWALLAGAALALMHATKETCIIAYASMLLALALIYAWQRWIAKKAVSLRETANPKHIIPGAIVGLILSAVLFSSFFTNWRGPWDSLATYGGYFNRARESVHLHPWWYYYLSMLVYTKLAPGPWWSEGLIVGLAGIGFIAAMLAKNDKHGCAALLRFLAFYTLILTAIYSKIPYKTPWCMLSFLHGMILLAGVGAVALWRWMPNIPAKAIAACILAAAALHLAKQSHAACFTFDADHRNPYVYSHPCRDVLALVKRVEEIAQIHPDGKHMLVKIMAPEYDYWPIPWYLREFDRIGYWDAVPPNPDAPIVIAATTLGPQLEKTLRDKYQINHYGLRPHTLLLLYIRSDLWDKFIQKQTKRSAK